MAWKIIPLEVGLLRNRPKDGITFRQGPGKTVDLACLSWLLLDGDRAIVVDTGPGSAELTDRLHPGVWLEEREALGAQLRRRGVRLQEVRTVILTHLHWDHCYGTEAFVNAELLVQADEIRYAIYPLPCDRIVYEFESGPPFLKEVPRMVAVEGACEVTPGVSVIPTPGHSPGHQSVLVTTAVGPYLIAGDHFDLFENWREMCPSGPTVDLASWYRSYEAVRRLGVEVLPGHDPAVLSQPVYG